MRKKQAVLGENRVNHPDMAQLRAFGHGKLAEAEANEIANHLAECCLCQEVVDNLPDDVLLGLIRPFFTPGQPKGPAIGGVITVRRMSTAP